VAYGVNCFKPKDGNYDLLFHADMIHFEKIVDANKRFIKSFAADCDEASNGAVAYKTTRKPGASRESMV
jgi:hypothetical protein